MAEQDTTTYEASAGGGRGDGTTAGTTGTEFMNLETLDDRDFPLQPEVQQQALDEYDPLQHIPTHSSHATSESGPFHNMVQEPTGHAVEGVPPVPPVRIPTGSHLESDEHVELQAAQAVADAQIGASGNDMPNQEVS